MSANPPKIALACLIVAHNLGDAVIQSKFLAALWERKYASRYLVWTRPQVEFLFTSIPEVEVVCSQFPVGTDKQFGGSAVFQFLRAASVVRRRRPDLTIDLIGDLRDRLFARLAGSRRHLHIGWAPNHPFAKLVRNPVGTGSPLITIPAKVLNVYDAHQLFFETLTSNNADTQEIVRASARHTNSRELPCIGIHPFASQECKLWPDEKWRDLVKSLLAAGAYKIKAFGAPSQRQALENLFREYGSQVELITGTIPQFALEVSKLDVMIGLDSFSIHMAELKGTPTIMINAGNPPGLWSAPHSVVLASSGGCPHYPCFNIPKCVGTAKEYACVRSIAVDSVVHALDTHLRMH